MLKILPRRSAAAVALYFTGVFFFSNMAFAQIDAGALQQQLQREVDRENEGPPPESLIKKPSTPSAPKSGTQTIEVKAFKITGNTLISDQQAQEAVKPYINQKLTLDQIKEAAAAVTQLYTNIGRVAQAVIPPQDVVNGVIQIKVIEGRVGGVIIELDKGAPSRLKSEVISKFVAANNPEGGFIDLSGLERSLALMNETPGNEVSGELSPGDKDGTSNIQVNARDTGLFVGRVDLSNYGAANTGVGQLGASLSLNNPAGVGDQATLDVIGSVGSIFAQAKYGMPVGYDGWRMSAGVSLLDYKSLSSYSPTAISQGTAQTYGLYSTYALERSAKSNKNIVINFENKNYNNLVNGEEYSRYQLNDLIVGVNGNNFLDQAYVSWGVTATAGHLSIDNTTQANNDTQGAATQGYFGKLAYNGSIIQPLPFNRTNVMGTIYGQFANKNLNSAEQLYLGGPYGVRAYPVAQGGGSQGAIASVEINHTLENQLQLGGFFDAGVIQQYKTLYPGWQGQTNAGNTYPLYATGLLAKYNYQRVQLSAALAWRVGSNPLYNQSGQQVNTDNMYRQVQGWIRGSIYF